MPAYITGTGICLPNAPVSNADIESVLGRVGGRPSRFKDIVLKSNQIHSRHYAIDPETRRATHTNAQLTAEAVFATAESRGMGVEAIDLLACGTSSPDQIVPSHACMVHGLVGGRPCEVHSSAGVCCSGIAALKYAMLGIAAGTFNCAAVAGSDRPSPRLTAEHFASCGGSSAAPPGEKPKHQRRVPFENDFLRWMLSDGAGAVWVEPAPRSDGLSLRLDWIDLVSFANELETCMYGGALKREDGSIDGWMDQRDLEVVRAGGYLSLSQDVRLLRANIVPVVMRRSLEQTIAKHELQPDQLDWVLPHLSSFFFEQSIFETLSEIGFEVPRRSWFTNLAEKGNTGAASIFIMLDELYRSGKLQAGQRLLCVVPESARFSFAYVHLTVV